MRVRQLELLFPIIIWKTNKIPWFQTTNQSIFLQLSISQDISGHIAASPRTEVTHSPGLLAFTSSPRPPRAACQVDFITWNDYGHEEKTKKQNTSSQNYGQNDPKWFVHLCWLKIHLIVSKSFAGLNSRLRWLCTPWQQSIAFPLRYYFVMAGMTFGPQTRLRGHTIRKNHPKENMVQKHAIVHQGTPSKSAKTINLPNQSNPLHLPFADSCRLPKWPFRWGRNPENRWWHPIQRTWEL